MKKINKTRLFIFITLLSTSVLIDLQAVAQVKKFNLTGTWSSSGSSFTMNNEGCILGTNAKTTSQEDPSPRETTGKKSGFRMVQDGDDLLFKPVTKTFVFPDGTNGTWKSFSTGSITGNEVIITEVSILESIGSIAHLVNKGTINDDGNTITGKVICTYSGGSGKAEGTFTYHRVK